MGIYNEITLEEFEKMSAYTYASSKRIIKQLLKKFPESKIVLKGMAGSQSVYLVLNDKDIDICDWNYSQ